MNTGEHLEHHVTGTLQSLERMYKNGDLQQVIEKAKEMVIEEVARVTKFDKGKIQVAFGQIDQNGGMHIRVKVNYPYGEYRVFLSDERVEKRI